MITSIKAHLLHTKKDLQKKRVKEMGVGQRRRRREKEIEMSTIKLGRGGKDEHGGGEG